MLATSFQHVALGLAEVAAVLAALRAIAAFPPLRRAWDWIDRHRQEDQAKRLIDQIDGYIGPKLAPLEQLLPNGGSSIADRVARVEEGQAEVGRRIPEIDRSLGALHLCVDGLRDDMSALRNEVRQMAEESRGHIQWHSGQGQQ